VNEDTANVLDEIEQKIACAKAIVQELELLDVVMTRECATAPEETVWQRLVRRP
jgi:hypothetical protein